MIAISLLVLVYALDGIFSRTEGLTLVAGLVIYLSFLMMQSRSEDIDAKRGGDEKTNLEGDVKYGWFKNIAMVFFGLTLLVLGSRWLVDSAVAFAQYLGVSELVIGLTIVAVGTSLPEVVTSVIAAMHGERDIAVGNVVGSNIFNILGVLGVASMVAPKGIDVSPAVIGFDIPVMIVVAFACLPIFYTGGVISRLEGALFLGYYGAYTLYLILAASHHDALPSINAVMLYFVIPLTLVTLVMTALRERHGRKRPPKHNP